MLQDHWLLYCSDCNEIGIIWENRCNQLGEQGRGGNLLRIRTTNVKRRVRVHALLQAAHWNHSRIVDILLRSYISLDYMKFLQEFLRLQQYSLPRNSPCWYTLYPWYFNVSAFLLHFKLKILLSLLLFNWFNECLLHIYYEQARCPALEKQWRKTS